MLFRWFLFYCFLGDLLIVIAQEVIAVQMVFILLFFR